jgi:hypothetical protein
VLNTIFRGGSPSRLNACVGDNGCVTYFDYAQGFSLAANALLDKVIDGGGLKTSPDYLIYPICFNMRHSIELRLKGAIEELVKVAKSVDKTLEHDKYSISSQNGKVNIIYVHNIKAIWDFFKTNALALDKRFQYIISDLEKHITDIANIDPTGQTFRYPISKESKKHLVDVGGIISCKVLKAEFERLHHNLDNLFHFTNDILEEYHLSSVEDGISRVTLNLIALNFRNIKSSEDFKSTKALVRKKFNISSRKLDSAIKRITVHFEFSSIVDERKILLGITELQLIEVVQYWIKQNTQIFEKPKAGLIIYNAIDFDFEKMEKEREEQVSMLSELRGKLSIEYSAGLHALFYFSRDGIDYSERYNDSYQFETKSLDAEESFLHVFDKTTMLEMILVSLFYLGFEKLGEQIINQFDLHTSNLDISKIMDTRNYCKKTRIQEYTQKYMEEIVDQYI